MMRAATLAQARDLRVEQAALRADEDRLSAAASRLQVQINRFAAHEALKAQHAAARAAAADQAFGGIWEQMGEVDLAARRAEDTTARLQALFQRRTEGLTQVRVLTPASFVRLHGRFGFPHRGLRRAACVVSCRAR
jgi:hypothetical protein